ncbi:hypothetical protein COBT_002798, partial [Conglomerata obtusa]
FRRCKSSANLSAFASRKRWWYVNWVSVVYLEDREAERLSSEAIKAKVIMYRERINEEDKKNIQTL